MCCKYCCYIRGLPQVRATKVPNLTVTWSILTPQFVRTAARACSVFCPFVVMDVLPNPSASATLIFLLSNTAVRPYIFHCGIKFSVHVWQPIIDKYLPPFILLDTKNTLLHVSCYWYKPPMEQSNLRRAYSAQADYNWTTLAACHRVTLSCSLSSVANHTNKISNIAVTFLISLVHYIQ
jgi:hypothetical protein